jgi:glycosyltransferase involved in cell wall biosynthesis
MATPTKPPLVSIITPSFNMADHLSACLASVAAQSYGSIEHIVIDGGSSDGTVELLRSAHGIRWVSEPDDGQSSAINKGFGLAAGQILGWLNADDTLFPDAIAEVVSALEAAPPAAVAYGDIEQHEGGVARRVAPRGPLTTEGLWRGNVISQPGTFWTRAAWEASGAAIDESFHLTMDYELWLRFAANGVTGIYVPEVLARFVIHDASKSGSRPALDFAEEEARALRKHGDVHGAAMAIDRWYLDEVVRTVERLLTTDPPAAARAARAASRRMHPVGSRVRWFLWLASTSPRTSRLVLGALDRGRPRLRRIMDDRGRPRP